MLTQPAFIQEIVNKYGTPVYIYDEASIKNSYGILRKIFTQKVDIFYSIKANPNISICSLLKRIGAFAEVCSLSELETAIHAGFNPEDILFVGPGKSNEEITRTLKLEIKAIAVESKTELERIASIAKSLNVLAKIILRINPQFKTKGAMLKMGGIPSQFGIDEEILFTEKDYFLNCNNIKILGIHIYNGTRILDANSIIGNTINIFNLADQLSDFL